jgi:hypothetical protein
MSVFTNIPDIQKAILEHSPDEFFQKYVLSQSTQNFSKDKLNFVIEVLSEEYGINLKLEELIVVGSSKLRFALHDKKQDGKLVANAFRPFGPESDIDLSICSPALFNLLWHELSSYVCTQNFMPYRHQKLGDYLTYGWLRQDHIPNVPAPYLNKCDNLRFARGKVRNNRQRGHPKVNFGIFHDAEHLGLYQARSIKLCRKKLENPL